MALIGNTCDKFLTVSEAVTDGSDARKTSLEANRPRLRKIDKLIPAKLPFLSRRITVALLSFFGFAIVTGATMFAFQMMFLMGHMFHSENTTIDNAFKYITLAGYLMAAIPAGLLATVHPANILFGAAVVLSSVLNMCTLLTFPFLFFVTSFPQLSAQAAVYPTFIGMMSHWAPPLERTRLVTLAFGGVYAGLCFWWVTHSSSFTFCAYGVMGSLWVPLWLWLVFEKPAYHTCIESTELELIESSLEEDGKRYVAPSLKDIPWKAIFTSKPVYAIIVASFCSLCSIRHLISCPMTYFQVYYFDTNYYMKWINYWKLPEEYVPPLQYGLIGIAIPIGGVLADWLQTKGIQTTKVRKLFICGGFGMVIINLLIVAFIYKWQPVVGGVAFLMAIIFSGFVISGIEVNYLDIAPRYAAILVGLSHTVGTIAVYICDEMIQKISGYVYPDKTNTEITAFRSLAVIYSIGAIFYGIFGSGELQPWAKPKLKEEQRIKLNELPADAV